MATASEPGVAAGARVLVVDDDPDLLTLMVHQLSRADYRVSTAVDGEQALQMAAELLPEVIVLDVMMPKLTGAEVLRRLRATPATSGIPVILVSASFDRDRDATLPPGADDYIGKPFAPRELPARVGRLLARPSAPTRVA